MGGACYFNIFNVFYDVVKVGIHMLRSIATTVYPVCMHAGMRMEAELLEHFYLFEKCDRQNTEK